MADFQNALRDEAREGLAPDAAGRHGPVEAEIQHIAWRLRRWREEADLTLQELARRSRVAASTIQKVETLQMVPTVGVLLKIARGLDRAPSELMRDAPGELHAVHLRKEIRNPLGMSSTVTIERLVGDLFEPILEAWRVTTQPGAVRNEEPVRWEGEALVLCEQGEMAFTIGNDEYRLREGDALHYKTTTPHTWRNASDAPARMLIITTLPRQLRKILHESIRKTEAPEPAKSTEPR